MIIPCNVGTSDGPPPSTLREVGINRIIGRTIIRWEPYIGSYGMGGPGFFGACLSRTAEYPEEWLILQLWGALHWLEVDGENVGQREMNTILRRDPIKKYRIWPYYFKALLTIAWFRRKILGWPGLGELDFFSRKIVGANLADVEITETKSLLTLQKGKRSIRLQIVVAPFHKWNEAHSHLDVWSISNTTKIYC